MHSPVDIRRDEADRLDNAVDVLGKAVLGLTVACARCHDHKFDAISTKDYYALFGFLRSSHYHLAAYDVQDQNRRVAEDLLSLERKHRPAVEQALAAAYEPALGAGMGDYLLAARAAILQRERRRFIQVGRGRKAGCRAVGSLDRVPVNSGR